MQTNLDSHITAELILSKFKEQFRISGKDFADLLVTFTDFLNWFDFPVEPSAITIKTNPPKYNRVESDLFVDKKKMHWLPFQCEHLINNKTVGVLRKYIQILNEMHSNETLNIDKLVSWWENRYYIQTPYFEWSESSTREYFINTPPFTGQKIVLVFPMGQHESEIEYAITKVIDPCHTKQKRIVVSYKHEWGGRSFYRNGKNCDSPTGKIRLIPFNSLLGGIADIKVEDALETNVLIRLTKEELENLRNNTSFNQSKSNIQVMKIPFWEDIFPNQNDSSKDDQKVIENGIVTNYKTFLIEPHRPPSKGGNTSALHSHALWIDGIKYTFLARGSKKWVYSGDTVTFEYRIKDGKYNNIIPESLFCVDKKGDVQCRGDRRRKNPLRTATYKR